MTHMGLYPSEPAVMMLRLVSRDPDDQLIHTILNILQDPEKLSLYLGKYLFQS